MQIDAKVSTRACLLGIKLALLISQIIVKNINVFGHLPNESSAGSDNCRSEEKFQCVAAQDENSVSFHYR